MLSDFFSDLNHLKTAGDGFLRSYKSLVAPPINFEGIKTLATQSMGLLRDCLRHPELFSLKDYMTLRTVFFCFIPNKQNTSSPPLPLSLDDQRKLFEEILAANEQQARTTEPNESRLRQLSLILSVLRYHPVLFNFTYVHGHEKSFISKVVLKCFQKNLADELENLIAHPVLSQVKVEGAALPLYLKSYCQRDFAFLAPGFPIFVETINNDDPNTWLKLITKKPLLLSQMSLVSPCWDNLPALQVSETSFAAAQASSQAKLIPHPETNAFELLCNLRCYKMACLCRKIFSLLDKTTNFERQEKYPSVYGVYIHALLSGCNTDSPFGMLLTAFEVFDLIYYKERNSFNLLVAIKLLGKLQAALKDIPPIYQHINLLTESIYLFALTQLQSLQKNTSQASITLKKATLLLTAFMRIPTENLDNELSYCLGIPFSVLLQTVSENELSKLSKLPNFIKRHIESSSTLPAEAIASTGRELILLAESNEHAKTMSL